MTPRMAGAGVPVSFLAGMNRQIFFDPTAKTVENALRRILDNGGPVFSTLISGAVFFFLNVVKKQHLPEAACLPTPKRNLPGYPGNRAAAAIKAKYSKGCAA